MTKDEIVKVIAAEVDWHTARLGTSGEGVDFERGFIEGLRQISRIFSRATTVHDVEKCDCETCKQVRAT